MKSLLLLAAAAAPALADVTVTQQPDGATIEINGQLFTKYHFDAATHAYYWPVLGPDGAKMTRSYPLEKAAGEATDHIHQKSMWFAHGLVNGMDFWGEPASYKGKAPYPIGHLEHVKVEAAESGKKSGLLKTLDDWKAPDGSLVLHDEQTLKVYDTDPAERVFDMEIALTAGDKDVTFGDTKEGSFGMRIAESMRMKQPKGPGKGTIVNSEGQEGDKVWGQHAKWVTMSGPVGEQTYSITMMDHPSNLRFPTRWHARDYGLFAANPFCEHEMDKTKAKDAGNYVLKAGEKLVLKYRVAITKGDAKAAKGEERWKEFAEGK